MAYKYLKVRDRIFEDALRSGKDQLPSEHQICDMYNVSRTTAIKALNSLAKEELVRREVGRGTFINRSRVKTRVSLLISRVNKELCRFAEHAAEIFSSANKYIEVTVCPIDSQDWITSIVKIPGIKVICSSHVGFLRKMDLLYRLDRFDGFRDTESQLSGNMVEWQRDNSGELSCYSLPLYLTPDVLAFNRDYARRLGLDDIHGPQDWGELRHWLTEAGKLKRGGSSVIGSHIKRDNLLPLSFYLTLSKGEHFIQQNATGIDFDFSSGTHWLEFFHHLFKDGHMQEYPQEGKDPLLLGRAFVSLIASTWILPQMNELQIGQNIGLCPIPPVICGQTSFSHVGKGEIAIVHDGKETENDAESAWKFIRFILTDYHAQEALQKFFPCLSTNRGTYSKQQADPAMLPFVRAVSTGRIRNDHPAQHYLMRILYKYYYAAVMGEMDCKAASNAITQNCRLFLELNFSQP